MNEKEEDIPTIPWLGIGYVIGVVFLCWFWFPICLAQEETSWQWRYFIGENRFLPFWWTLFALIPAFWFQAKKIWERRGEKWAFPQGVADSSRALFVAVLFAAIWVPSNVLISTAAVGGLVVHIVARILLRRRRCANSLQQAG